MTPLVLAHRGACWEVPENTLEAFELAIVEQADYVEFDVRTRRNGELVVCHDAEPPADAPTLEEVLTTLAGRVGLAVEVKEAETSDAVLDALERHDVEAEQTIVVSFHLDALAAVSRRRPELRCILHTNDPSAAERFWGIGFEEPASAERVHEAHALGLATTVFTVNDAKRMLEVAALGVTGIFTDRPGLARRTLRPAR